MTTLCLVMIVRNEEKVIKRCLNQIKDAIDYWVIVDTGSNDRTMDIITETLKNVPGEMHQREWINFGMNRTQSLQLAKNKADYLLLCDADELILISESFDKNQLTSDAYLLPYIGANDYSVPYLIKGNKDWFYEGVTHEYLDCLESYTREKIATVQILDLKDGGFKRDKYERDIQLLEQGLIEDPTNSRYKFYLANSYRDVKNYQQAIIWYQKRIDDGGWYEEVTCAYENLGQCYYALGQKKEAMITWLKGYDFNPNRMECLYEATKLAREDNNMRLAYQLGKIAKAIPYPKDDVLFIQRNVYELDIYFELSISAYFVKDYSLGYQCCQHLLLMPISDTMRHLTMYNLQFYQECAKEDRREKIEQMIEVIATYLLTNQDQEVLNLLFNFKRILDEKVQKEEQSV